MINTNTFFDFTDFQVGEALMRSPDPGAMVAELLGHRTTTTTLVKICGVRSVQVRGIGVYGTCWWYSWCNLEY
jgi:hypothetical protein